MACVCKTSILWHLKLCHQTDTMATPASNCLICCNSESTVSFKCCTTQSSSKFCCLPCLEAYIIDEIANCVLHGGKWDTTCIFLINFSIWQCVYMYLLLFSDEILICCPHCRQPLESLYYCDYAPMPLKALFDLKTIIRTCKICLSYKVEGELEERERMREHLRTNIFPNFNRLYGQIVDLTD